jgi:hypothetical protein
VSRPFSEFVKEFFGKNLQKCILQRQSKIFNRTLDIDCSPQNKDDSSRHACPKTENPQRRFKPLGNRKVHA